ncbi:MAG TPA: pilus assembly protein PilX [Chromatiales bacterium]|nr:pilus assembly protein PilX [Chromatiales bacterium]
MNIPVKSRGAVLITGLVFLLILTLLGLSAMQSTTLEQRMAGNSLDSNIAFQAAEAALRTGESVIGNWSTEPTPNGSGSNGVWSLNAPDPDANDGINWWDDSARGESWWNANGQGGVSISGVSSAPRYLIEERDYVSDNLNVGNQNAETGRVFYRLTARGKGSSSTSRVMLQSTYVRRY